MSDTTSAPATTVSDPQTNTDFQSILDICKGAENILILSHMRPDGDAIGCQLAMQLTLQHLGKSVTTWNEDVVPDKFKFLAGADHVSLPPSEKQDFDVVVCVDTAVRPRVGTPLNSINHYNHWINIDHHITNDAFGDFVYVDSAAPAAGAILFELFSAWNLPITKEIAEALFVAISTDTGSFRYPSTSARTLEIAAELVHAGINIGEICQTIYDTQPYRRIQLLKSVLNTLDMRDHNRIASVSLSQAEAQAIGAIPDDTEGVLDNVRAIDTVLVAVFFEELIDNKTVRVSMRSKDARISVSKICAVFNGGGHTLAAGARIEAPLNEAKEKVLAAIQAEIAAQIPATPIK